MSDFDPNKPLDILAVMFSLIIFFAGMYVQHSLDADDKECTVTIKDMRGTYHVLKGVADAT